jgi:hypothetical protein
LHTDDVWQSRFISNNKENTLGKVKRFEKEGLKEVAAILLGDSRIRYGPDSGAALSPAPQIEKALPGTLRVVPTSVIAIH